MILTREAILEAVEKGEIEIDPYDPKCVGPGSYDLAIANEFRFFKKAHKILEIEDGLDYKEETVLVEVPNDSRFIIMPGECAHAITLERVRLPGNIFGWLQGRSTFARLGLMVHITASAVQPGVNNRQVLEMFNASPVPLGLRPGSRICQIIFQRCEGSSSYAGRYKNQSL
jgi:dCTP deaminase